METIDKLWTTYSEGKFGYSVQKKIWNSKKVCVLRACVDSLSVSTMHSSERTRSKKMCCVSV